MSANNPIQEANNSETADFFQFKNDMLLLPEHTESEFPETEFLNYGTSDGDLQF